ncbi:MAG: hypothetical protein AAF591_16255 [Verrucomicrobiota bacterium]
MRTGKMVMGGIGVLVMALGVLVAGEECVGVGKRVGELVEADRARVLVVVEEEVSANPGCACEIVKAAIEGSGADESEELLKQIVITALNAAAGESATIAECAVAAAPDSAGAVKEAMRVALGAGGSGAGKGVVGKRVVLAGVEEEGERDWVGRPVTIGGVYLIYPLASAGPFTLIEDLPVTDERERVVRRTTTPPPVSAANGVRRP